MPNGGFPQHDLDAFDDEDYDDADDFSLDDVVIPDHPCPPSKATPEEWAAEAMELDYLHGTWTWREEAAQVQQARREYDYEVQEFHKGGKENKARYAGRTPAERLLRAGFTIDEVAARFMQSPRRIANLFTVDAFGLLKAEPLIREGKLSYPQIAEATGLSRHTIGNFAKIIGANGRRVNQGNNTFIQNQTPEGKRQQVRELAEAGLGPTEIGKRLGMNKSTVFRMCRREGWGPK